MKLKKKSNQVYGYMSNSFQYGIKPISLTADCEWQTILQQDPIFLHCSKVVQSSYYTTKNMWQESGAKSNNIYYLSHVTKATNLWLNYVSLTMQTLM